MGVLARDARNRQLSGTFCLWDFAGVRDPTNGVVGILHGWLRHHTLYDERIA